MIKVKIAFVSSILIFVLSECREVKASDNFHGMWRLDKYQVFNSHSGAWVDDTARAGYSGFILYDGEGHMAVQLIPKGYKEFSVNEDPDSLSCEDAKATASHYQSNYVYFANYAIADSMVEHKIVFVTNREQWGLSLQRNFEFRGDTLILTPLISKGIPKARLIWIKA